MTDIESELAKTPRTELATASDNAGAVVSFNPLDAEPVSFAKAIANRQDNYDQLQMHLRAVLVQGIDFGTMHVMSKDKCKDGNRCTIDWHYSKNQLRAPGADKVLGILGLGIAYPDIKDYKRAILTGHRIEDVLIDCVILDLNEHRLSQGAGAASRKDFHGDLNNTLKRACKRARLDGVLRLPTVSALFESDFLDQLARDAAKNKNNSTAKRAQKVKNVYDTGARLEFCPIGKEIKGKPWHEIDTGALEWLVANVTDKPDITRAAAGELTKRVRAPDSGSIRTSSSTVSNDEPELTPADPEWLKQFEEADEWAGHDEESEK